LGGGDAFDEVFDPVRVHQKTDAAAVHPEDRHALRDEAVQRLEHEAVAAERDDDACLLRRDRAVALPQFVECLLSRFGLGCDKGNPRRAVASCRGGHPPVTLIWRAMAGRLWRRSMMKSCPLGLRSIAARIAASSASSPSDWRSGVRKSAAS